MDSGKFDWSSGRFPDFTTPDPSYHGLVYWDALKDVPGMGNVAYIIKARVQGMRNVGLCPSPFNAFLFLQGLETLPLRIRQQSANTLELSEWLKDQDKVEWGTYTGLPEHPYHDAAKKYLEGGFGAVLGFGIKAGVLPLHVWLPLAHPAAPTPASGTLKRMTNGCTSDSNWHAITT